VQRSNSVEVTRGKLVEAELNQFIEKRHDQRVSDEGERPAEEAWAESEGRYIARRREENRVAWVAYYRRLTSAVWVWAEEYDAKALQLENRAREEHSG